MTSNLYNTLIASVARTPDAVAVVDGEKRVSYDEYLSSIDELASGLMVRGVGKGDHVCVLLKNRYETTLVYWACQRIGAIYTPLNWRYSGERVHFCLRDAGAKVVFFENASRAVTMEAADMWGEPLFFHVAGANEEILDHSSVKILNFQDCLDDRDIEAPERGAAATDFSIMMYTSGTTGNPKGVPRTHLNEWAAAMAHIAHNRYRRGEVAIGVMPLYHTMGVRTLISSVMTSGCYVCVADYNAERLAHLIAQEKVSAMFLVPTLYHDLIESGELKKKGVKKVSRLGYAGMAMSSFLAEKCVDTFKPDVWVNYYGSTEVYTMAVCDHIQDKPGCAGLPGLNQQIRVVDIENAAKGVLKDVSSRKEGEIVAWMKSPEAFQGYWHRDDADRSLIVADWYRTGDVGYFDEDRELYVVGRVDDMIISGGENINPENVENIMIRCNLIKEVAVIGRPDQRYGGRVVAYVVPRDENITEEEIMEELSVLQLSRYERPKEVVVVPEIPKSAVGKILRRELRKMDQEKI